MKVETQFIKFLNLVAEGQYTTKELAGRLGVSERSIYRYMVTAEASGFYIETTIHGNKQFLIKEPPPPFVKIFLPQ